MTSLPKPANISVMWIGVISDTHGWLDPRAADLFAGTAAIVHAGDIGAVAVLDQLARIGDVRAVRGNVDRTPDLLRLPERIDLSLAGVRIHLVHRPQDARPAGAHLTIAGHTHRPMVEERDGTLWINPGAAGRRGFHRQRTLALVELDGGPPRIEIVYLGPRSLRAHAGSITATR